MRTVAAGADIETVASRLDSPNVGNVLLALLPSIHSLCHARMCIVQRLTVVSPSCPGIRLNIPSGQVSFLGLD